MSPITTARTGTLVLFFILLSAISFAQSDDCSTPTSLTPGTTCTNTTGTLSNATSSGIAGSCAGTKYDVWYSFTTPAGCTSVNIDAADIQAGGSNITSANTFLEAFSGATCSTTSIGSCTPIGTTLTLTGLSPSTTYQLRVYTTTNPNTGGAAKWDYNICITYTAPPANDDCSGAITLTSALTCTTPTAGTVVSSNPTAGLPAGCESAGTHNDVWYKFVAANTTEIVTISGQGSGFTNPEVQLYSGACGTLTSVACGTTTLTATSLTIGATYYARVSQIGSSPATNGGFNICITHPTPPPANDDCSGAVTLTSATTCATTAGTLVSATSTTGLPVGCESASAHYDVWYKFVAANAIQIVTISGLGSNFTNSEVQLYSGACGTLTSLACGTTTLTSFGLTVGATYYVRVSNVGSSPTSNGGFSICITHPLPAPANDDCSGATTLTSSTTCTTTGGTLVSATATGGVPAGCQAGTHYDVWYKFNATNTIHTVTISSQGTNFTNAEVQLFSGTCGALTSIGCGNSSVSSTSLTVGATYYIRVSNIGSIIFSNGGFNICVTHPGATMTTAAGRMNEVYKQTTLSGSGILQYPWEITYGPDSKLWITESRGYKVYRMDPNTGASTTVLDISMGSTWLPSPLDTLDVQFNSNWPQGGLAGLAIHPQFLDGTGTHDYVYISYVHRSLGGTAPTGRFYRNKVVRFKYNSGTNKLESPEIVADNLPGSNDHNSQRILIAPVTVGGTYYLFYAEGDMGAGQFDNRDRTNNAQNPNSYEGKILRFNAEPDGDAGANAWIPNDNPYNTIVGSQTPVYSIGIRNNQGFAYDPVKNLLYGASHGPYSDDEINVIEGFRNYGHPLIEGFADGNYNGNSAQGTTTSVSAGAAYTDNLGQSSCPPIGDEVANKNAINALPYGQYKDPLFSAYPVPNGDLVTPGTVKYIWRFNPGNATPAPGWPTEAWSGLDIYTNTLIPGWKNSLVAASLKWGRLLRVKLDATGTASAPTNTYNDSISYFNSQNRFRDLAFSPDGKDVFVVMDNTSTTSGPGSANPVVPACAGCVQKYTFLGYYDNGAGKSTIPTSIDVTPGVANSCTNGTTVTIDANNNNLWVPITGPDGNIMAEIFANGNNLGTVTSTFYKNGGSIRVTNNLHYLDRNMTITPQFQPSSAVKIRLYISKAELDALIADPAAGVFTIGNLQILKNDDPCSNAIANTNTTLISPIFAEAHGSNGYVLTGSITSFSSFYFAASNFTLPLDILTFTGQLQNNNSVLLNWKTDNEVNTSHFIVERSTDGSRFTGIGNVAASGTRNNTGPFNYSYTDNDAANQPAQRLYYRLKMVDIDGSAKYSNIVVISMPLVTGKMTISPNPVISDVKVTLASPASGKIQWKIMDNVGRTIMKGAEQVLKGPNNFTINMNRLPAGTYYLELTGAGNDQKVKMQKL